MQTRIKIIRNKALDLQKRVWQQNYIYSCTYLCPVVFRLSPGNFHSAPEGRKLIESIYSKNNNYLLIDRACKDDKTLVLAKNHGFKTVVPPKKKS